MLAVVQLSFRRTVWASGLIALIATATFNCKERRGFAAVTLLLFSAFSSYSARVYSSTNIQKRNRRTLLLHSSILQMRKSAMFPTHHNSLPAPTLRFLKARNQSRPDDGGQILWLKLEPIQTEPHSTETQRPANFTIQPEVLITNIRQTANGQRLWLRPEAIQVGPHSTKTQRPANSIIQPAVFITNINRAVKLTEPALPFPHIPSAGSLLQLPFRRPLSYQPGALTPTHLPTLTVREVHTKRTG